MNQIDENPRDRRARMVFETIAKIICAKEGVEMVSCTITASDGRKPEQDAKLSANSPA